MMNGLLIERLKIRIGKNKIKEMKISYNWLQKYFKEKLPSPGKMDEVLTFKLCEIEGVEKVGTDTVIDMKILPDRAHYALCHRGIAKEISAIFEMKIENSESPNSVQVRPAQNSGETNELKITILEPKLCQRYIGRLIKNVSVKASPEWLKGSLEAIGQRSIANIVDATNYVMFDMGEPLHAFDADKVKGGITVRMARDGEFITTLDNKEVKLDSSILVIADDEAPLAIAGIKGGKKAEVDENTKNIILESAHFDASYVRLASQRIGIKTESSKRYENAITPLWTEIGSDECSALIAEVASSQRSDLKSGKRSDLEDIIVCSKVDVNYSKYNPTVLEFSAEKISDILGTNISENEIVKILESLDFKIKKALSASGPRLSALVPRDRLDIMIAEDLAEEVGRIYGYEKIASKMPAKFSGCPKILPLYYYSEKIRDILSDAGFSEVTTYSFCEKGDLEVKAAAMGKNFLRKDLSSGMVESLKLNFLNSDLIGIEDVKIFEIGRVFTKNGEENHLAIGTRKIKKQKGIKDEDLIKQILVSLNENFGISINPEIAKGDFGAVCEINLDELISKSRTVLESGKRTVLDLGIIKPSQISENKYKKISPYPFMVRDIAVFVSPETKSEELSNLLKKEAGDLLVRGPVLFDEFSKDGKKSLAFRMVFQSYEKTLTDTEVNSIMTKINEKVISKGWVVR